MNNFKVQILTVLMLSIMLLVGCGDDNPSGPGEELTVEEGRYALDISGDLPDATTGKARLLDRPTFWSGQ